MLKGEVLRSAISHHEVDSIKHLNRVKRDMYDLYSMKKTPSIQAVRWKPEHNGLVMSGFQLGSDNTAYGSALKSPPDRYLKRAETAHQFLSTGGQERKQKDQDAEEMPRQESRLHQEQEEHKKALQQAGVEVVLLYEIIDDDDDGSEASYHVVQGNHQPSVPQRPMTAMTNSVSSRPFSSFPKK